MKQLGQNLRKIRKKWGMSQQEIADFLKVSKASLSLYETGANDPKIPIFVKICKVSGLQADALYNTEVPNSMIPDKPLNDIEIFTGKEGKGSFSADANELWEYPKLVEQVMDLVKRMEEVEKGGEES